MDLKTLLHDDDVIKSEGGGLLWNPFNSQNIEITLTDVQSILVSYGLPPIVNNFTIYRRAFIHRSYTKRPQYENMLQNIQIAERPPNCPPLSTKSNETLEFLGDGVLELAAKFFLYRNFPKEDEGFMTDKKIAMVKNESIGRIVMEMGLHKWLIVSRNAEEKGLRTNIKKLGCLFESFIGAIFLDFNKLEIEDADNMFKNTFITGPGWQFAQLFLENVFEKHVDRVALITNNDNYKNLLQVVIQKEFKITPDYLEMTCAAGDEESKDYRMGVFLCLGQPIYKVEPKDAIHIDDIKKFTEIHETLKRNGTVFVMLGRGDHKIKKKAEQIACERALKSLRMNGNIQ